MNLEIVEWVTTMGVFIACFLFLLRKIEGIETKQEARMQEQTARTDRLYEMFIDLLKEQRKAQKSD